MNTGKQVCGYCRKQFEGAPYIIFVHAFGLSPPKRSACSIECKEAFEDLLYKCYKEAHTTKA